MVRGEKGSVQRNRRYLNCPPLRPPQAAASQVGFRGKTRGLGRAPPATIWKHRTFSLESWDLGAGYDGHHGANRLGGDPVQLMHLVARGAQNNQTLDIGFVLCKNILRVKTFTV
jgi:hypothetical protein